VGEITHASHQPPVDSDQVRLTNDWWEVDIRLAGDAGPCRILDRRHGLVVADEHYSYSLDVITGPLRNTSQGLKDVTFSRQITEDGQSIILEGQLDLGRSGPTDIYIRHRITLPDDAPWLEEQLSLVHRFGRHTHQFADARFGFRKVLYDRERNAWKDGLDRFRLVAVPFRRHLGQHQDRYLAEYAMADLFPRWDPRGNLPNCGSEAWIVTDAERGLLVAKYNQEAIEYSLFQGEYVLSGQGQTRLTVMDAITSHAHVPYHLCARFGGAGLYRGDPESAQVLGPEGQIVFGPTRLSTFSGDWPEGYHAYKAHLRALGHGLPADYNPPLHWNELYNLGWRLGDNAPLQTRQQLDAEGAIAADVGVESLYLDPTWDVAEGTTVWDAARLGPQTDFVRDLHDRHHMGLSLHLMMHTTKVDEDPTIYRRDAEGKVLPFSAGINFPHDPLYVGAHVCCASLAWKDMKVKRLLALAEAGATFFMFDFVNYGACWEPTHGHSVPLTRQEHAAGLLDVVQAVKRRYPHVLIEAHDWIGGEYQPLYYQHGRPFSFDERWGFEFMWDPYYDLLSGRALSLYEYNLAYEIPLYLHIHEGRDSTTMLAFWWYASTCRHLGIGGVSDPQTPLYAALKQAVTRYRRLKRFFTQGEFVGIDPLSHLHVLPGGAAAVALFFNLSNEPHTRTVALDLSRLGLASLTEIEGGVLVRDADGKLTLTVEIAPLSPALVELNVSDEVTRPRLAK